MAEPLSFFGTSKEDVLLFLLDSFEKQYNQSFDWRNAVLKDRRNFRRNCAESPEEIIDLDGMWPEDNDIIEIHSVHELKESMREVVEYVQGTLGAIEAELVEAEQTMTARKNLLTLTKDALDNNNQADILVVALENYKRQAHRRVQALEALPTNSKGGRTIDHIALEQVNFDLLKMLIHLLNSLP